MKKTKIQNIILYIINAFLIGFIILSNKGNLLNNSKIILKNMDESTQVSDLNKSIHDLNKEHTEYSNYIQASKANLAQAITNAGINTNANDDFEVMANNISNLIINKTSNATAVANNISEGKTAWVNGNLIIGTGEDNKTYYNQGYIDGQKASTENIKIQYTYHKHQGSEGPTANGCYTKRNTGLCQVTSSSTNYGQCEGSNSYHGYSGKVGTRCPGGEHWYLTRTTYTHSLCGQTTVIDNLRCGLDGATCPHYATYTVTAGAGTQSHNVEVGNYILGCGKTEETVESATIVY